MFGGVLAPHLADPSAPDVAAVNAFDNALWAESDPTEPPHSLAATRRAARARDGDRCQCCGSTWRVELHHVTYWDTVRRTRVDDLVALSRPCHVLHHAGLLHIVKNEAGDLEFTGPDGQPHRPYRLVGRVDDLKEGNRSRGVEVDPAQVGTLWDGSRLDHRWIDLPDTPPPTRNGPAGPPPPPDDDDGEDGELAGVRRQLEDLYEHISTMRGRDADDPALDHLYQQTANLEDHIAILESGPAGPLGRPQSEPGVVGTADMTAA